MPLLPRLDRALRSRLEHEERTLLDRALASDVRPHTHLLARAEDLARVVPAWLVPAVPAVPSRREDAPRASSSSASKSRSKSPSASVSSVVRPEDDEEVLSEEFDSDVDFPEFIVMELGEEDDVDAKRQTTLALRLTYASIVLPALGLLAQPELGAKLFFLEGASALVVRAAAAGLLGWGLALIAASQANHDAQRKTLQYSMVTELAVLYVALTALATADKHRIANQVYVVVAVHLLLLGAQLQAVYFQIPKDDDDDDDEEDEDEDEE